MTPDDAAASIGQLKGLVDEIASDKAICTVFTSALNLLRDLCVKEITGPNFDYDIQFVESLRNLSVEQDPMRNVPLRKLIYALNESIQITAKVLVEKYGGENGPKIDGPLREVKEEPIDFSLLFQPASEGLALEYPVEPKTEEEDAPEFNLDYQGPVQYAGSMEDDDDQLSSYDFFHNGPSTSATGQGQTFHCPLCPNKKVDRTLRNFETHLRIHHGKTPKQAHLCFVCKCGYIANNFRYVQDHKKLCGLCLFTLKHSEADPDAAPPTLKRYRTKTNVNVWEDTTKPAEDRFICPFCKNGISRTLNVFQKHLLFQHKRTPQQAKLVFICNCGYSTQLVPEVNKHKKEKKKCKHRTFTMHLTTQ